MLSFSVKKQKLERKDTQEVVGGTYNYLYVVFDFSYDWDSVSKNAVFNNCKAKKNFTVPIVENICLVPWEVIESPNFTVSLYGFTDNKRITSNEVMIPKANHITPITFHHRLRHQPIMKHMYNL